MTVRVVLALLLPLLAWGQSTSPTNQGPPPKTAALAAHKTSPPVSSASTQSLPPSAPVITVAGVCGDAAPSPNCSTTVTRKEFEDLVDIVQPGMAAAARQRMAVLYSQALVFANAAQRQGLDKTPEGEVALRFSRLQALSQVLTRKLQAETSKVSDVDIQKYYREHLKDFEEASIERLYIPRKAQAGGKTIKEEDAQAEMAKLRTQAAQGASFATLQKQAYADLGLTTSPPATDLEKVRRGGLSSAMASVFDLELGVVSQPISEADGLYVLRLMSKRELSLQDATPEVTRTLQAQRLQHALQEITASAKATFDSGYFGVGVDKSSAGSSSAPGMNVPLPSPNPAPPASGVTPAPTKPQF